MADLDVRRSMPPVQLDEAEFKHRFLGQFADPNFEGLQAELEKLSDVAWRNYSEGRKAPLTRKAGPEYAVPDYDLSVDWLEARQKIAAAREAFARPGPARILLVNGAARSEHTCPGETSKTYRLQEIARELLLAEQGVEVDVLDLSRLASEYGRNIFPCKTCFSTSPALCHWPCSCYPNHSLGQTRDWMNDIYPLWTAAHGVMLFTPVNWYFASSPLKLMMDRLVCADGGNPDPTRTCGKDPERAKEIELAGWDYPQHLKGRLFSVVVHGDAEGAHDVRRALSDWLTAIGLESAGGLAELDRYIGYWKPYATSHADLDSDGALQQEVRNAAALLLARVRAKRNGVAPPDLHLQRPRRK